MNTKKMGKIIAVVLIAMMLISVIGTPVQAAQKQQKQQSQQSSSKGFTPSQIQGTANNTSAIETAGQHIVGVLQAVGIVLSVIMLSVIGIKYLMGSAEEKADYKKSLMPYVVGAALIFTASVFAQAIYEFFSGWSAG